MFHALSHQLFGSPDRDFDVQFLLGGFESKSFPSLLTQINAVNIVTHTKEMLHPTK